jgi:nucleotide-binding universal stress UspA family protein
VINRILVATDASAASNRALEMAAQFAVLHNAELLIIHVIRDMQKFPMKSMKFRSWNSIRLNPSTMRARKLCARSLNQS